MNTLGLRVSDYTITLSHVDLATRLNLIGSKKVNLNATQKKVDLSIKKHKTELRVIRVKHVPIVKVRVNAKHNNC